MVRIGEVYVHSAYVLCLFSVFKAWTAIHSSTAMTAYHLYSIGYFSIWQTVVSLRLPPQMWREPSYFNLLKQQCSYRILEW